MSDAWAVAVIVSVVAAVFAARDVVLRVYSARQAEREDKRYEEVKRFVDLIEQKVDKLDKRVTSFESNRRRP